MGSSPWGCKETQLSAPHSDEKSDSDSTVTGSAGQLSNWVLCVTLVHYVPLPLPPGCPPMCEEVCALNSQPEEENTEVHERNSSSPDGVCVCVFQENVTNGH